jgi:hypothetical protein
MLLEKRPLLRPQGVGRHVYFGEDLRHDCIERRGAVSV